MHWKDREYSSTTAIVGFVRENHPERLKGLLCLWSAFVIHMNMEAVCKYAKGTDFNKAGEKLGT